MDWKTDQNQLAKKIEKRILAEGEVSYSDLEKIALEKDIDLNVFDAALSKLHRFKKVTQTVKKDDIYYKPTPKPKPKPPDDHMAWLRENYPRPEPCGAKGCTGYCKKCMPFPEIDMSYLFLKPSEMLEYKAKAKGMPIHMMKRIHKYGKKK